MRRRHTVFIEKGWEEGGCGIECESKVIRVEVRLIEVRPVEE